MIFDGIDPITPAIAKMNEKELRLLCDGLMGVIGMTLPMVLAVTGTGAFQVAEQNLKQDMVKDEKKASIQFAVDFSNKMGKELMEQLVQKFSPNRN